MFSSTIEENVKLAVDSVSFEKVSDLSKEQFTEILTYSLQRIFESPDFSRHVVEELGRYKERML
ncbi:hypothetical protein [Rhodopseudomonas parapalustris]